MERFFEFIGNHWILSTLWVLLLVALLLYQKSKSGKTVSPQQATLLVNRSNGVFVDIRDKKEFDKGHIPGSMNIPLAQLKTQIRKLSKYKDKPVIAVCKMGQQASEAVKQLEQEGFTEVSRMAGGLAEWDAQGLPLSKDKD